VSPRKYYDISSTASRLGGIDICITYNQGDFSGSESSLMLFQYDTSVSPAYWHEITTSINTSANIICGTAQSLGKFVIAEPISSTGVEDGRIRQFQLYATQPNPFRSATAVQFDLPGEGHVILEVFDLQGRLVRSLVDEDRAPGRYTEVWEGRNDAAQRVAPGIYFYRLRTDRNTATQKVIKVY
jgi:hypothetical protein